MFYSPVSTASNEGETRITMSVIRPATEADVPVILKMIHELAVYEKEPDAVRNTPGMLAGVLFGEGPRVFATMAENAAGEVQASPCGS
ncbi:acetyltransferase [Arthrobacter sp. Hiyo6]|nr:acetyltransferase [Arthrobacter sp. Hiyo6]